MEYKMEDHMFKQPQIKVWKVRQSKWIPKQATIREEKETKIGLD